MMDIRINIKRKEIIMRKLSKLNESSILMRLSFGKTGNIRQADLGKVSTEGADKARLKLGKVLFTSDEFSAIGTFDGTMTSWVQSRAIGCDIGYKGVAILPLTLLASVEAKLEEGKQLRAELVEKFLAVYDQERETARGLMKEQFKESNYPPVDEARQKFRLNWSYVTFEVPKSLPAELREREGKKLEQKFAEVEQQVVDAMRESFRGLIAHLAESLTPKADGKQKKFYDTTITKLVEFLALFKDRNIMDDDQLAKLAEQAQRVIGGITPEKIRENASLQKSLREEAEKLNGAITELIVTAPRRKMNLDDD